MSARPQTTRYHIIPTGTRNASQSRAVFSFWFIFVLHFVLFLNDLSLLNTQKVKKNVDFIETKRNMQFFLSGNAFIKPPANIEIH